jgi:hypothetical protein
METLRRYGAVKLEFDFERKMALEKSEGVRLNMIEGVKIDGSVSLLLAHARLRYD